MGREVDFVALMTRMFANLKLVWWQLLVYLAVVTVLAFVVPMVGDEPSGLVGLFVYFAGQYWLFRSLLKARGLVETPRIHIFAFVGLAVVLFFPIMFGLALFLLPGLFLIARYIAAPSYIVARGDSVFAAAANSWRAVRGHTVIIAVAATLIFMFVTIFGILTAGLVDLLADLGGYRRGEPKEVIDLHLIPLLLFGLSTAVYDLLGPRDNSIEEVFG